MEISLSILSYYEDNTLNKLNEFNHKLNYLHLDVMDGKFVNNKTFDDKLIKALKKEYSFFFDTHIMIEKPELFIKDYVLAGSDCITFHYEATKNPMGVINDIHSYNVLAGISVKPMTEIEEIESFLSKVDLVLVMSVEPGFGGQRFLSNAVDKVKRLKELKEQNGYSYKISIDGGINKETLTLVKNDVDIAVCGSYITRNDNPLKCLEDLKHI